MVNYIWAIMILIGVIYGAYSGNLGSVTTSMIEEAKAAVNLGVMLVGVIAFWTGIMKIAEEAGIIFYLTRRMDGIVTWLFPDIPKKHKARKYIATNMIANILGLGWAATPPGLLAMEELQKLNKCRYRATKAMCTFLIINISSVQLVSVNMLAYRAEYGSADPAETIGPALLATVISTLAGIIFCKIMERFAYD